MIDETKLKKVSTIAREKNQSKEWIYKQIDKGVYKSVKIDGMTFIDTSND